MRTNPCSPLFSTAPLLTGAASLLVASSLIASDITLTVDLPSITAYKDLDLVTLEGSEPSGSVLGQTMTTGDAMSVRITYDPTTEVYVEPVYPDDLMMPEMGDHVPSTFYEAIRSVVIVFGDGEEVEFEVGTSLINVLDLDAATTEPTDPHCPSPSEDRIDFSATDVDGNSMILTIADPSMTAFDGISLTPKRDATFSGEVFFSLGDVTLMEGAEFHSLAPAEGSVVFEREKEEDKCRVINLSTRGYVGTGDDVLIGGIIIEGTGEKEVLISARGPSLDASLKDRLADPTLKLVNAAGEVIAESDNWATEESAREIAAAGGRPSDFDAAILTRLAPGAYTAIVEGVDGTEGIAILEINDLDPEGTAQIRNLSTRGSVGQGDRVLIGGMITSGGRDGTSVILRGRGPSMPAEVSGRLSDPVMSCRNGAGEEVERIDDWQEAAGASRMQEEGQDYLPVSPFEAATVQELSGSSAYTTILSGANSETGVGIVEVFVPSERKRQREGRQSR